MTFFTKIIIIIIKIMKFVKIRDYYYALERRGTKVGQK